MVRCVTTHAEKGAGMKTTLYVGQEEAEEVGEDMEEVEDVGARRENDKPHKPLMTAWCRSPSWSTISGTPTYSHFSGKPP